MIALIVKGVRTMLRQDASTVSATPKVSEDPSRLDTHRIIAATLRWNPISGDRNRYSAEFAGERWELYVDDSNQGLRLVLAQSGKWAGEVYEWPTGWTCTA